MHLNQHVGVKSPYCAKNYCLRSLEPFISEKHKNISTFMCCIMQDTSSADKPYLLPDQHLFIYRMIRAICSLIHDLSRLRRRCVHVSYHLSKEDRHKGDLTFMPVSCRCVYLHSSSLSLMMSLQMCICFVCMV